MICDDILNTINFTFDHKITGCCLQLPNNGGRFNLSNLNNSTSIENIMRYRSKIIDGMVNGSVYSNCIECPFKRDLTLHERIFGVNKNVFNKIIFEWNTSCNANCSYCDIKNSDKTSDWNLIKPLFDELLSKKLISNNANILISGGEPSIINEFDYIIQKLIDYSIDIKYHLFSTLIKRRDIFDELYSYNMLDILISLDSANEITYKKIKGVNKFDNVISNIKFYASLNPQNITVKFIVSDDNYNEVWDFMNLMNEIGIKKVFWDFQRPFYPSNNVLESIVNMTLIANIYNISCSEMKHGSLYTNVDNVLDSMGIIR